MKNVLYFRHLNEVGGVESMFFYLAKKYQNYDITVYYSTGDFAQIKRLSEFVRVKKYKDGEIIKCDRAFFNYNTDIIDSVEANEYIQIIHGDFEALNKIFAYQPNVHPKIDRYVGVSKHVCETFTRMTGKECELCYNPILIDEPKKVLRLISAQRLTPEKGKNRIIKLAEMLDAAGVPYQWTIFTNDTNAIKNPNVIYMKPRLDVVNYIADADYLVQLSDTEGYCYSILESLIVGTPVIVTALPILDEMHVVNGVNGFVVDFDMKNVPIAEIYKGLPPFEYKVNADGWAKLLVKGKSTYKQDRETLVFVKARQDYFDLELQKLIKTTDDPFQVSKVRAENLDAMGLASIVDDGGGN